MALNRGVTAGRLRAKHLSTPIRGARLPRDDGGLEPRCRAFLLHRDQRIAFSHATAARLLGAPLPADIRDDGRLHVSVPAGERAVQAASVAGHTLAAWETVLIRGLPVTTPEQTWLDPAGMLGRDALVSLGDWLVSYRHPVTSPDALAEIVRSSPGRRGITNARAALRLVRTRSESPGETRLRLLIVDAALPEPELNHLIHPLTEHSSLVSGRREHLEDLGWRVVRVTAADLRSPAALLTRLSRLLTMKRE